LELFPLASVAVQVTVLVPLAKLVPDAGTHRIGPPGHLSVNAFPTRRSSDLCPGAVLTVRLPGQLGTGRSVSVTVTVKVQLELLPLASVAVQVTVLVPLAKLDPEAGTHRTEPPGQLSVNEKAKLALVAHCPGAVLTVRLPGQLGTGRSVSVTVTVKVQLELLPLASVAVQVTVLVPLAKLDPEAGRHRIEPPGQLSVNENAKLTLVLHWPGAVLTVIGPGQLGTGRSVSVTVTVKMQFEVLPLASVAVQVT